MRALKVVGGGHRGMSADRALGMAMLFSGATGLFVVALVMGGFIAPAASNPHSFEFTGEFGLLTFGPVNVTENSTVTIAGSNLVVVNMTVTNNGTEPYGVLGGGCGVSANYTLIATNPSISNLAFSAENTTTMYWWFEVADGARASATCILFIAPESAVR